jgi:uncharacterized protein (DUF427 family)
VYPFPRRVRAAFGGQSMLDTTRAMLLHETGLLPPLYAPLDDIRAELLRPTEHPQARGEASDVSGYLCFGHDELFTEVGQPG